MYRLFYRIALALYKWACIHKIHLPSNKQVEKDLARLHPGENPKQICMEYYVGKLAKSLLICAVGLILCIVLGVQEKGKQRLNAEGEITRGEYQEEPAEIEMECLLPDGVQNFTVEVGARVYDKETIFTLYDSFAGELGELILGENLSLQDVTQDLCLLEGYEGYPFTVEWKSADSDIVQADGGVRRGEYAKEIPIRAIITYGDWEWEQEFVVQVAAMPTVGEEYVHQQLQSLLQISESESRTEKTWKLPESWQGQTLQWKEKKKSSSFIMLIGGVCVAVLVFLLADKDLHDSVEKRKQQMKKEYPDVVHKLTLYLGAGMTIRGSFQKMAEEYETARKEGKKKSPVYEGILHICREVKSGVSEGAAYEHFGRQTGLQEYIRLCTMLTQNLKKGNSTLLQRLREEAERATVERIQFGKQLGEEAVTKLLLPMVLMLLVVMLMIMIPAFSSMGT